VKTSFLHISLYFLYSILLFSSKLYAQQFGSKLYTVNDGLPSTSVYGAYQDKYNYLWICTPNGLSRFNGRQFVNYSLEDGLPSLHTSIVFQDSRDRLWVGTTAGMAQFKNNRFVAYPTNDKLNNFYVFNFIETKDKRLWALTTKGVYEFADTIWKKISLYPGYENNMCRSIVELNGELYVNYATDILCKNKEGKWLYISSSERGKYIFNVMSVQNNEIWVSTINNIYIIRNHQLVPLYKKNLTTTSYFSYLIDSKKRLWLESENLLQISKPRDWQHFPFSKINQYGFSSSIIEDSSHNVWIGTIEGLLKIKDISFTTIDKNNNALLNEIYNLVSLPDDRLFLSCGPKTGLLVYANNQSKQIMPPNSAVNENYYKDPVDIFAFDEKNTLWMITRFRRFLHFDGNKLEDFSAALNLKTTEHVYDMEYIKSRHQFFICADSTLLYGSSAKFSTFIPHNTGVPIIKPTRVYEMKNGLLLLYIDGVGVYCIDESNNLISLVKETGIDGSKKGIELHVLFYEDANNNFWISFPGLGLYEYGFKKNKVPFLKNHITVTDGLQGNDVVSLINDRQNRLWVATATGLDIIQENKANKWEVFNCQS
jgi:ligand-binding sensor domain-containing protein